MNLIEIEKQRIANLCNIRNSQPNIELECIFNYKDSIQFTDFANIFSYIKNKAKEQESVNSGKRYVKNTWKLISSTDNLDITVHRSDNIHSRWDLPIRLTVHDKQNISKYCQSNSIKGLKVSYTYKNNRNLHEGIHASYNQTIVRDSLLRGDKVIVQTSRGKKTGIIKDIIDMGTGQHRMKYIVTIYSAGNKTNEIEVDNFEDINLQDYGMYLDDYDIKINMKSEVDLYNLEGKEDPDYFEQIALDKKKEYDSFVQTNGGLENVYKTYRLKNRYSYRYNNLRLDITVVRSSATELNNKGRLTQVPKKSLINSNLTGENKKYEVELEIEYNYSKHSGQSWNVTTVVTRLLNIINDLKLQISDYPSIISKEDSAIVLETYKSLIRNNHATILNKKKRIIQYMLQQERLKEWEEGKIKKSSGDEGAKKTADGGDGGDGDETTTTFKEELLNIDDISEDYVQQYTELIKKTDKKLTSLDSDYRRKLDSISKKSYPYSNDPIYFIGPRVVSMELSHIQKDTADTILTQNYCVTDKADGLGMLLYVYGYEHLTNEEKVNLIPYSDDLEQNEALLEEQYKGQLFLIDQNLKVYKTNLKCSEEFAEDYNNSVFNGEYLNSDRLHTKINMFKIYDAYIYNNQDIKHLPLRDIDSTKPSRIKYINKFLSSDEFNETNILKNKLVYKNQAFSDYTFDILIIRQKKFLYYYPKKGTRSFTKFYKNSNEIWNTYVEDRSEYKYDGLIYTPTDTPVAFNHNSCDYDLFTHTTWTKNLKWKPPYENTIDFLVKEVKEEVEYKGNTIYSPLIKTKRNKRDGNVVYQKYKTFHLYVGKNIANDHNSCRAYNSRTKSRYLPVQFVPSILYDDMAYVANIEVNLTDNEVHTQHWDHTTNQWKPNSFEIIKDDTIIEFAYSNFDTEDSHYKTDKTFRWIPMRTRHDKTFSYRKGGVEKEKIYNALTYLLHQKHNSYNDSTNNRFKSSLRRFIHSVRESVIAVPNVSIRFGRPSDYNTILNKIISNADIIQSYYSTKDYISSRQININYGNNFNTANNVWFSIHNPITEDMITTGKKINELNELKYYNQNINIKRSKSISINLQRFHNTIKFDLIRKVSQRIRNGDSTKQIHLLDLATGKGGDIYKWIQNNINKVVGIDKVYDNIYNSADGACVRHKNYREKHAASMPSIDFIVADVSNDIQDDSHFIDMFSKEVWYQKYITQSAKFNMVTMMFALHYMFNSEEKISMLAQNINNMIEKEGYFIGCCFDGKEVYDLLRDTELNGSKVGYKDGKVIWKIQKKYNLPSWDQSDKTVFYNLPIDVYIQSINMNITEYLVNFDILQEKLKKVNIVMQETVLFKDIYTSQSKKGKIKLSNDEQTLSFLNRYFICKKVSDKEIAISRMIDISIDIGQNKLDFDESRAEFKYKTARKELRSEIRQQKTVTPRWDKLKDVLYSYIQFSELNETMPILEVDFDTIMGKVFTQLQSKYKQFK